MGASAAILAGKAFVELATNNNPLVKGLKAAEGLLKGFADRFAGIAGRFSALGASIWGPMVAGAHTFAEAGTELLAMSERTGLSVESLSQLKYAGQQAHVSIETLEMGLRHMAKTQENLNNEAPDEMFARLAEEVSSIQDPLARSARAMEIFGRQGTALLPLLNRGAAGIKELREQADRMGLTKNLASVKEAEQLQLAFQSADRAAKGIWTTVGAALAPALTDLLGVITSNLNAIRTWVKEHKSLIVVIGALGAGATGVGIALGLVSKALGIVGMGFSAIAAVASLIFSPMGIIIAGVGLIVYALGGLGPIVESVKSSFGDLFRFISDVWGGIDDAIQAGNWALATEIALGGVKLAWMGFRHWILDVWRGLKDMWRTFLAFCATSAATVFSIVMPTQQTFLMLRAAQVIAGLNMEFQEDANESAGELAHMVDLRNQLNALRDRARAEREMRDEERWWDNWRAGGGPAAQVSSALDRAEGRGTFNGLAVAGLGVGPTLTVLQQIERNTRPDDEVFQAG